MPLCRLRQAVEAANSRRRIEQLERIRLTEWQARTTCSFIAAQAGLWMELKKGQANPMLQAAMAISITGGEKTPEELELEAMRGPKVADSWEEDPRNPRNQKEDRTDVVEMNDGSLMPRWLVEGDDAAAVNQASSYEALMAGWNMSSHGRSFDTRPAEG